MNKRFICFIMTCVLALSGCASSHGSSVSSEHTSETAEKASSLVNDLELENMQRLKDRVVLGMIFDGDQDAFTSAAVYKSKETGDSDTVGVFDTKDTDKCLQYLEAYMESEKESIEHNYPSEVFKISNAILLHNDSKVIFIVCSDIESAKSKAKVILGI